MIKYVFSFVSSAITCRKTEKVSGTQIPNKRNVDFSIQPFSKDAWQEYWNKAGHGKDGSKFFTNAIWSNGQLTISVLLSNGKTYKFKGKLNIQEVG